MGKRKIDDIDRSRYQAGAARGGFCLGVIVGPFLVLGFGQKG
jgi:hypothetical protein